MGSDRGAHVEDVGKSSEVSGRSVGRCWCCSAVVENGEAREGRSETCVSGGLTKVQLGCDKAATK